MRFLLKWPGFRRELGLKEKGKNERLLKIIKLSRHSERGKKEDLKRRVLRKET